MTPLNRFWYVSVARRGIFVHGMLLSGGFLGAFFIDVEAKDALAVIRAAQAKYDFIPPNCQCEVLPITELPPPAFRDRFLSRQDLDALDAVEPSPSDP